MIYMIHIYLVSFIYLVLYLLFTFGLYHFTYIPSHRGRPEDDIKRLQLVCDLLWTSSYGCFLVSWIVF